MVDYERCPGEWTVRIAFSDERSSPDITARAWRCTPSRPVTRKRHHFSNVRRAGCQHEQAINPYGHTGTGG